MCLNSKCSSCESSASRCETVCAEGFFASKYVDILLTKGSKTTCDESEDSFNKDQLPPFYDEKMFKKGQAFFHKNIFGMFLGSFLGLLADLSNAAGLAVLIMTKMSGSDLSAYKRYMATIHHMMIWYESDFVPGSDLWLSIRNVKFKHKSASKKAASVLKYRITQKEMALAQWGFIGVTLCRPEFIGIHDTNEENWRCFVHLWRVIGHILGITDEFNICKESLEETKAICHEIALKYIAPNVAKREKHYTDMCKYLVNGMWPLNPFLEFNSFMFYMDMTINNDRSMISNENPAYRRLKWDERLRIQIVILITALMKLSLFRILLGYVQVLGLWLIKNFPLLAYWRFGVKNANFTVIPASHKS